MTARHSRADNHKSAADKHRQAAQLHRGASRHFEVVKDREHGAHRHAQQSFFYSHEAVKQFYRNAELDGAAEELVNWAERKMIG